MRRQSARQPSNLEANIWSGQVVLCGMRATLQVSQVATKMHIIKSFSSSAGPPHCSPQTVPADQVPQRKLESNQTFSTRPRRCRLIAFERAQISHRPLAGSHSRRCPRCLRASAHHLDHLELPHHLDGWSREISTNARASCSGESPSRRRRLWLIRRFRTAPAGHCINEERSRRRHHHRHRARKRNCFDARELLVAKPSPW